MARGTALESARRLCLFGPMRVERQADAIHVPRGDAQRLLGYLALRGTALRREAVAEALWPGPGPSGRRSLSDTLYRLRRRTGVDVVCVQADTVAVAPGLDVDVQEFERLAANGDTAALELAREMYDELVPGIYDDWALEQRAACHTMYVAVLRRLADRYEVDGDLDRAATILRQLLAVEPFDESAHQVYLRLLGRLRRYAEAKSHFEALDRLFVDELGTVPLVETIEIVKRLERERDVTTTVVERTAPFVGRVAERAVGLSAIEAIGTGRGGMLCVEGVAGVGKTRLLAELVSSARWRRQKVASASVWHPPEASSLSPLSRALGPLLSAAVRAEVESRLDDLSMQALAPLFPGPGAPSAASPTADAASQMRHALSVLGAVLAGSGNVVVVLDDVHWASTSTWDHLDALAGGFVPAGGLLIVASRPLAESTRGWSVLQKWDRQALATFVRLEPLQLDDVVALLGRDARVDADEVIALTGGLPFYIVQGLDDGDWRSGSADRIDALAPEHRQALDVAAILGDSVGMLAWADILGLPPLETAAVGDRLVADRWLKPTEEGYTFIHDLVRTSVYDAVDPAVRRSLHRRAAAVIARIDPENWRARAYHLDNGGEPIAAADAYRQAGRISLTQLAPGDALESFLRAVELLPPEHRRQRMELVIEAVPAVEGGGQTIGRGVLEEAIDAARELGDDDALLSALLFAGGQYARIGDDADGLRWLDEAERLARAAGEPSRLADVLYRRAVLVNYLGRWPDGERQLRTALGLVDAEEHPELHGRLLAALAEVTMRMGRPHETVEWMEAALARARVTGDSRTELYILKTLTMVYFELCDWDRLEETSQSCLALARRFGAPGAIGTSCQALSLAALAVGDRVTARAMIDETRTNWLAAGQKRLLTSVVNTLGLIAEDDGDEDEAIARYEEAIVAAEELDAQTEVAWARHDLGALHLAHGRSSLAIPLLRASAEFWTRAENDLKRARSMACLGLALLDAGGSIDEAGEIAEDGLRLFRSGDHPGELVQHWMWSLSRLLDALGRRAQATELLAAAHAELLRQAATISDPERRRGFFERVPLNRAIIAAVDARTGLVRAVDVRLASSAAPLGRTLRPDEMVEVSWTLDAPDDAAIADEAARRRHRLRRLLGEAADQGAAPTDSDLAAALDVSRRTVLRDLSALGARSTAPTRRRSRGRS